MNAYDFDKTVYYGDSTADFYLFCLKRHKKIITLAPSLFGAFLNLIASKVNMQSGKYTGVNCHGKEKVKRFYEAFPNGKIDSFYSDSYSDSPLAEIADKAFMVDGDKIESWILIK